MGMVLILVGLLMVAGLALVLIGRRAPRGEDALQARLVELGAMGRTATLEELELSLPFTERVIRPLLQAVSRLISRMTPAQTLQRTRRNLELAGLSQKIGPGEFVAIRYILCILLGGGAFLVLGPASIPTIQKIALIGAAFGLGFYLPGSWLGSRIRRRQQEILKSLPDALDLLTICVEAGLSFDAAMAKVVEKWDNELSRAFARVLQEIQLGRLRREALRNMADTMDVREVSSFVAALIQADQLGVSIAKVLRIQSDQMRVRRRQRAEELARQAPIKMIIPIVFLIFPALLIVLLGPGVIIVLRSGVGRIFGGG
ncbi:MAG: type II secretion system F family protein [Anaerolineae bacterium]|nr:type II secretion system F family protein [Anaerolineae bacterium]MDW8067337.1 type II secretion system F family protein [Anaerolineae bacterium]